jgi:site-specific DNA recombinase
LVHVSSAIKRRVWIGDKPNLITAIERIVNKPLVTRHRRRAPAGARLAEINNEIADLTRRLQRQVLNLEADDITPAARCQITTRMAELEATIMRRQADADQARAELDSLPPDIDETSQALARLPELADGIADLPQGDLRRLYNALDVRVMYQPVDRAIDIEITLTDAIGDISALPPPDNRMGPASQFCSVPPAGFEPATHGLGNRCSIP